MEESPNTQSCTIEAEAIVAEATAVSECTIWWITCTPSTEQITIYVEPEETPTAVWIYQNSLLDIPPPRYSPITAPEIAAHC